MNLEEKYIQKYRDLHLQKTGQQLSDAEAIEYFTSLVELVRIVYQPIPHAKREEFERILSQVKYQEDYTRKEIDEL